MNNRFDMRAVVVLLIFFYFAFAFYAAPQDETLKGALIAAFSGAWGFYLGSSKSSAEIREQVSEAQAQAGTALAVAAEAVRTSDQPTEVKVVNPPDDPANVTEAPSEELPDYAR